MSFPRFDRLILSDGGPLLIQYISDACVSSRQNDKPVLLISQNQSTSLARCAFELEVHRYMRLNCLRKDKKRKEK